MILKIGFNPLERLVIEIVLLMDSLSYNGDVTDFTDTIDAKSFAVISNDLYSSGVLYKEKNRFKVDIAKININKTTEVFTNPFNYERFNGLSNPIEFKEESIKMLDEIVSVPLLSEHDKNFKISTILNNVCSNNKGIIRFGNTIIPITELVVKSLDNERILRILNKMKPLYQVHLLESIATDKISSGISDMNHVYNILNLAIIHNKYPYKSEELQVLKEIR
jgi:hypothetical protein